MSALVAKLEHAGIDKRGDDVYCAGKWEVVYRLNRLTDAVTVTATNGSITEGVFYLKAENIKGNPALTIVSDDLFTNIATVIGRIKIEVKIRFDGGIVDSLDMFVESKNPRIAYFYEPSIIELLSKHQRLVIGTVFDKGSPDEREVIEEFDLTGSGAVLEELRKGDQITRPSEASL